MVKDFKNKFYLFLVYLFLYLPILVLIVFSFNSSRLRGSFDSFSLIWYKKLFTDRAIMTALSNTLVVALLSTIISTILGTISAIGIYQLRGRSKDLILNLNYIPVINPDIVTAVAMMSLFKFFSVKFGFSTMLISHVVFSVPYVILNVLPKLNQLDKNLIDASMDLGATPFYSAVHVIVPQIKTGIITGALMAFTLSIDDFIISYFNTGHGYSNLSILIYSMAKKGVNPSINALSTLMFGAMLLLVLIINKSSQGENENE
ncbi:ABC transporter permease [Neofamilia massiliensis]|uniref:ABC transporter permease n=1 Tax=Neofamilia massiliensis TaxID=1673724 RepID=UPI0006BB860D|nr:ABC transporter permease [Neofamilia massiliensis]